MTVKQWILGNPFSGQTSVIFFLRLFVSFFATCCVLSMALINGAARSHFYTGTSSRCGFLTWRQAMHSAFGVGPRPSFLMLLDFTFGIGCPPNVSGSSSFSPWKSLFGGIFSDEPRYCHGSFASFGLKWLSWKLPHAGRFAFPCEPLAQQRRQQHGRRLALRVASLSFIYQEAVDHWWGI